MRESTLGGHPVCLVERRARSAADAVRVIVPFRLTSIGADEILGASREALGELRVSKSGRVVTGVVAIVCWQIAAANVAAADGVGANLVHLEYEAETTPPAIAPLVDYTFDGAILGDEGCYENSLYDGSNWGAHADLPFTMKMGDGVYDRLWVNTTGALTFGSTPHHEYGEHLERSDYLYTSDLIAPLMGVNSDWETDDDSVSYTPLYWGFTEYEGKTAFCATWLEVSPKVALSAPYVESYYARPGYSRYTYAVDDWRWWYPAKNSFQVLIVDQNDAAPGDFDIIFNYDSVQWQTYQDGAGIVEYISGEPMPRGEPLPTRYLAAGWSFGGLASPCDGSEQCWKGNFDGRSGNPPIPYPVSYWFPQGSPPDSLAGAYLDDSPTGLAVTSTNSSVIGRHAFSVHYEPPVDPNDRDDDKGGSDGGGTPPGPITPPYSSHAVVQDPALRCSERVVSNLDDGSTGEIPLDFAVNFYGDVYTSLWVNNNGSVTFDGPFTEYRPVNFATTDRAIIAPFMSDVDTRGTNGGVLTYNYGDGSYEGNQAFCAIWYDVGYYSRHSDKTNRFQLILVDRPTSGAGAFDIIFNYDTITWDSGDASGGVWGLGGSGAQVGFANGTPTAHLNTGFALYGSGVAGAFVDSGPRALSKQSFGWMAPPGRQIFRVRPGGAVGTKYVALGDSYQSGEGAGDYMGGTDTNDDVPSNMCHRSANAYPQVLVSKRVVPYALEFWACSGALVNDLYTNQKSGNGGIFLTSPPWDDPARRDWQVAPGAGTYLSPPISALDRLGKDTQLVTIGIGGNDLKFGPVMQDCATFGLGNSTEHPCRTKWDSTLTDIQVKFRDEKKLEELFREIRRRAPYAEIIVLGYPRFFVPVDVDDVTSGEICSGISAAFVKPWDQYWIDTRIKELDDDIATAARKAFVRYVDIYDVGTGHELGCTGSPKFMNALVMVTNPHRVVESFHPTAYGHSLIEEKVAAALSGAVLGRQLHIDPHVTSTTSFTIGASTFAYFNQFYEGSDIEMTLISPSGERIDRSTTRDDVTWEGGATYDYFTVADPEPGEWTIELYGANVAPLGEWSRVDGFGVGTPNELPTPRFSMDQTGNLVTFDASASTDPDGVIVDYRWDFGDGTSGSGVRVRHTYATAGEYWPTLAVIDDAGAPAFETMPNVTIVKASDVIGAGNAEASPGTTASPAPSASSTPSTTASVHPEPLPSPSAVAEPGSAESDAGGLPLWLWIFLAAFLAGILAAIGWWVLRTSGDPA